ncbi:MAG: polysaccharide deacetylase family protein, partial [Bacteroidales bacterium]|nr:polysaccharide deacetylase family protein [Bacteroidales bacterium]
QDIPVLFPCSTQKQWYSMEGNQIRFHHDILKSAFYLLSGYQEVENKEMDEHGRYPWKSSVQYRHGFTHKPVVNYYFNLILEAFESFCEINGLDFERKQREAPLLFLSHDVDRIRKYSIRNLAYVVLQLLGIKSSTRSFSGQLKTVMDYAKGTLLFRKDPYWNFGELVDLEKELNISSTWYLLEKTKMDNSRYHFTDERIRALIRALSGQGHEIGIHGTLESSDDPKAMSGGIQRINAVCENPVTGNRQHYLKYDHPGTSRLLAESELIYDATLGFAESAGFRNSFAHPFRLYDFDRQQPMDLWHLPLNVMDVTLLGYMMVPVGSIPETIRPVVQEVKKFNGVFSFLWHNCNLDEEEYPGINEVYQRVLKELMDSGFISMTGDQVIKTFRSSGVSGNNWSA